MNKRLKLSRLMAYAGKYRFLTYASWVLSALSSLIALVPFWCIWKLVGEILYEQLTDDLSRWGWLAMSFAALSMVVYIAGLMCSHLAAFRIASNIRMRLLEHVASLPLGSIEKFGSGHLRRTITETSGAAETYLAHQLPDKYGALGAASGIFILLTAIDWRLCLLSILPTILGFVILSRMTGQDMQEKITEYQNALSNMSNEAVEYVRGIPVVKTFGQTVLSFRRFKKAIQDYERWTVSYTNELRIPMMCYTLAVNSIFIFLIAAGIFVMLGGIDKVFLMNLIFTIIAAPLISTTLTRTMRQSEQEMITADAVRRIDEILALPPLTETQTPLKPEEFSVDLEGVTFSYEENKPALSDIPLSVKSGQSIALVGPSGGGKTTAARLVARFFDPQEGLVLIGGVDVKNIPVNELMNQISFVFQDSHLVKGSILENLKMAKPGASREEILEALKSAQCMDILEKFPDGIDTVIGSGNVHLSGGEVQRIAVARAILKDAPIIVLDEATAFADPDNERRMQEALSRLAENKTVILIAHRLSTIINSDKIFVLKDGRVVENGNFNELVKRGGLFSTMWKDYCHSVNWKVGA